ncbi:hypothetical protein [Pseudomonas sp. LH1G9]|uniref:hypothetical protein n=1 Tax=Pseudomonas sp. LH1G9 TaxID=2083055 RepID=UPI000CF35F22|nr:hypothetical protein [Pseudomonas sp. LH1G9]
MSDYTELQKVAAYAAQDTIKFADEDEEMRALQQFHEEVDPETILALIAENDSTRKHWQNESNNVQALMAEVLRLNAECEHAKLIGRIAYNFDGYKAVLDERDQLRAEIAGLKTGYEAYEPVNAELKAEVEALRDDLEQKHYDANAWRNGEESAWIEVFHSEGDDPFISAISGQITVEQLALIQAEILEYRDDYFEKGSGLYVFRCGHCQAHYDNVGMTEPAHWETDFESYSPFPWEEEAALGQGEQS